MEQAPKQDSGYNEQVNSADIDGKFNADGEWEWDNTVGSLLPEDPFLSILPSESSSSIEAFPELQDYDWDYLAACLQEELYPVAAGATTNEHQGPLSHAKDELPPVLIYPSFLSNLSQIQPRTQKDFSRYYGPPRLENMPRFKMYIIADPAPDYISNNQDLRSGINGHLFGGDSRFGFGPAPTRLSPTSGEYPEELYLSPIRLLKRKREGETSPTPSSQSFSRPDKRQRSESADRQDIWDSLSLNPEPQEPPFKRGNIISSGGRVITVNPQTKGLNSRSANIESFNPSKHYKALEEPPQPWGVDSADQFTYNQWGELDRAAYTTKEILDFIYSNPSNQPPPCNDGSKTYGPKRGTFTLWIQTVPADSNRRYPTPNSDKCRFQSCPAPNRTIAKGFHRIALDEHCTTTGRSRDPYHVAGYLHLYCAEKLLDFHQLCADGAVQADVRSFPAEKNRMSIVRDHEQCIVLVKDFMKTSTETAEAGGAREQWCFEATLECKLTVMHLELQPQGKARASVLKGTRNHIGMHRNDLDVFLRGEEEKWGSRKQKVRSGDGLVREVPGKRGRR